MYCLLMALNYSTGWELHHHLQSTASPSCTWLRPRRESYIGCQESLSSFVQSDNFYSVLVCIVQEPNNSLARLVQICKNGVDSEKNHASQLFCLYIKWKVSPSWACPGQFPMVSNTLNVHLYSWRISSRHFLIMAGAWWEWCNEPCKKHGISGFLHIPSLIPSWNPNKLAATRNVSSTTPPAVFLETASSSMLSHL